jgi:hypothetical protein
MSLIENKHCEYCESQCLSCDDTNDSGAYAESHLKERYAAYHNEIGYEAGQLSQELIDDLTWIRNTSLDDDIRVMAEKWIQKNGR